MATTANLTAIAEDVRSQLDAAAWDALDGQTITQTGGRVERGYVIREKLEELKTLLVTIVAPEEDMEQKARGAGGWQHDPLIEVALQKRAATIAECDAMAGLTQEVSDWFKTVQLSEVRAALHRIKLHTAYSQDHIDMDGTFTSILLVTFRMLR